MVRNKKKTSTKIASLASKTLQDKNASATAKKLAASALAQTQTNKQTGKEMETFASKILKSNKYSDETKTLAATVLAQSNKER
ncbi:MAG: hypothetical protein KKE62_14180 [Proteobacteria bacterium]|nr:hypothetical protein [Pseudomonadota bacterium]MBU1543977.1 hypothetical protein [Pseudomonadota bacterium]MBU2431612.1 hypothetical protein [Pseudomonadota bacterium]MBU2479952.1 hypothetical protein [Pseudomonadota bacterium]